MSDDKIIANMTLRNAQRAEEAVITQMTADADVSGWFYTQIKGVGRDVCAFFKTRDVYHGSQGDRDLPIGWITDCTLSGAWVECGETGDVLFAGNRDETVALVGEYKVRKWEDLQTETENA
jgi:hypothetical protein